MVEAAQTMFDNGMVEIWDSDCKQLIEQLGNFVDPVKIGILGLCPGFSTENQQMPPISSGIQLLSCVTNEYEHHETDTVRIALTAPGAMWL